MFYGLDCYVGYTTSSVIGAVLTYVTRSVFISVPVFRVDSDVNHKFAPFPCHNGNAPVDVKAVGFNWSLNLVHSLVDIRRAFR